MKDIRELREILCQQIDDLRDKKTTPANVNAIVNATGKILTTVKMEMEYAKMTNRSPDMGFMALPGAAAEEVKSEPTTKTNPTKNKP